MKKIFLILAVLMLWASPVTAQRAAESTANGGKTAAAGRPFEGRIGGGWYGADLRGSTTAGEYHNLESSPAGALTLEWDPLPHRFVLDSYYLNPTDYFGEVDYSFTDVIVLNGYTRSLFHNLNHYSFGPDDLSSLVTFTDHAPEADYHIDNHLSRGFIRLKTPDFPLHLYADTRVIDREGTIQQRFLLPNAGTLAKISQSRKIDWETTEYRVGMNSHLGPIEADYSHTDKKFEAAGEKVLTDVVGLNTIAHNRVPDLRSSSDSVKLHTNYSGKFVLAGTYTAGDKENEDRKARVEFANTSGDIMIMPVTSLIFTMKYRHYELDVTNPDTVTATGLGPVSVRDSISSTRDIVSGVLRYRATDHLTLRGEYSGTTIDRKRGQAGTIDFWALPESTTKNTGKVSFSYRIMNKVNFRADYSATTVDNPAYATDPDKANSARMAFTWMPAPGFHTMLSYGIVRESRDELSAPLGGGNREAARDQALASATVLVGSRSSITAAYAYYKNNVEQTVTLQDGLVVPFELEPGVPYTDTSNVGTLALTLAPIDNISLIGSATKSYCRGSFSLAGAGTVNNVSGIADLSDMKIIDTVYSAGIEIDVNRYVSGEVRYQYRHYDDEIDDAQDGRFQLTLATLFLKW